MVVRRLKLAGDKEMRGAKEFSEKVLKNKNYRPSEANFKFICG